MKTKLTLLFLIFVQAPILLAQENQNQEARLLRFPTIYNEQVVFTYAGDLYTVEQKGGIARRLTSDEGYESFPRFSPDGKTIAFTAQFDGNTEIYTIPAQGGLPKRLTYTATLSRDDISDRMGPNNICIGWTPDGKNIIYRSRRYTFNNFIGQLLLVSPEGGLSSEIPLTEGGFCSYSPDGQKMAFNQVFREFRTWKYYTGGMADDIRIFDFETKEITKITNTIAQDIIPMWHGNEIYFLSDRDRTMNLFVYNTITKETKKVTDFTDYDIKFPSLNNGTIIFERGGYIYTFEIETQKIEKIPIKIANDIPWSRSEYKDLSKKIKSVRISPDGNEVVVTARGDIFTVPAEKGIIRNLTKSCNAHDRQAIYSPDGKYIAYLSDQTGEYQIYIKEDEKEPIQLTKDNKTYIYSIKWSPDSKKIFWHDREMKLQYIDVETKKITLIDQSQDWELYHYNCSPDSKWLVFARLEKNNMGKIYLYNFETKKTYPVTKGWFSSLNPNFSNDGKYLIFSSDRNFSPTYSQVEWNYAYKNLAKLYIAILSKDTPSPFSPIKNTQKKEENKNDKEKNDETKIDIEGIYDRIVEIPMSAANSYSSLYCINDKIYCKQNTTIKLYDLNTQKETTLGESMGFVISTDNKKMLVSKSGNYYVIPLASSNINLSDELDFSQMKKWVDYKQEWKQIYDESWRQMRDFFAFPNMHGVDWKKMHDKYAVLVPHVNHRADLTYIIGELIGELNIGHAYVNGGEQPKKEKIKQGLLGAKISAHTSGFYQIDSILQGANWNKSLRSPLTEIGVNIKQGEYLIAINDTKLDKVKNPYKLLINSADQQVELTVNSEPKEDGSRKVIITPISNESDLYYYNWVQNNIRKVNEATNGEVGYIHIPDMSSDGLNEFVKHYYPQLTKKALIIDDRGNGGGNVSPMIIERLRREMILVDMARNVKNPSPNPSGMHVGPKIMLINKYSASDGDIFPYRFKSYKLGMVVGERTWGAVTGIRGSLPFVDGGVLYKPEFAKYSTDGKKWVIEGIGVSPDITIENNPAEEYTGKDTQLEEAIKLIQQEMQDPKYKIPEIPPFPLKNE